MALPQKDGRILFILCILAVLYAAILILDFSAINPGLSKLLKYAGVCACFVVAVLLYKNSHSRQGARLLVFGMLFTLVSDAFLLFSNVQAVGIATFMFAHLCYIKRMRPAAFKAFFAVAAADILLCAAGLLLRLGLPYVFMLGSVYALLIAAATVSAFRSNLPKINKRLACAGMVLFVLCDTSVTISNLAPAGSALALATFPLIYLFYIPSQACLAMSAGEYKK